MIQLQYPIKELPEPFQSMATGGGKWAFKPITTQGFGENANDFYRQLGLKGHNGIDYVAPKGTRICAAHDGKVTKVYNKISSSRTIGYGIWLTHPEGWTTVYYHLDDAPVIIGQEFKAGEDMAPADNTGEYTTGDHLHFGLYPANINKENLNTMLKTVQPKNDNRVYAVMGGNYYWITSNRMYQEGLIGTDKIFLPFVIVDTVDPTKIIGTFNKES
jgi:murein DD-endopeptidase MepM/ murein hydrolase activator NlpD